MTQIRTHNKTKLLCKKQLRENSSRITDTLVYVMTFTLDGMGKEKFNSRLKHTQIIDSVQFKFAPFPNQKKIKSWDVL